ncbi:hypothetical protein BU17DRAFT_60383 [Hysterangium stoloniferum]|nr:hypothetical protein BU17DRAFT_60383 [Hysterangium stoloniferum]
MTWKPKNDIVLWWTSRRRKKCRLKTYFGFDIGTMERLARGYVLDNNDDEDGVNGSESVGKAIPVGDGREGITFEEKRRISSSFMESSLVKSRISSFTTDVRSSTSLTNLHASSSFSPSPCTTSYARRIPDPTSRSRSHFSLAMRKGQPSPSPLSKNIVQLREGSPDSHLASDERSNGEQDDEDETQSWVLIGFWIRLGVGRTFASRITDTSIPYSFFNQTTCKHKKSQLTALELKGRPIATPTRVRDGRGDEKLTNTKIGFTCLPRVTVGGGVKVGFWTWPWLGV